jgi:DNA-binding transcriptional MerR regulator
VEQDPDRLLTTAEAAKLIGVSRATLSSYARKGLLRPEFRLPTGSLRWTLSSLRRQLAEVEIEGWQGPTPGDG